MQLPSEIYRLATRSTLAKLSPSEVFVRAILALTDDRLARPVLARAHGTAKHMGP